MIPRPHIKPMRNSACAVFYPASEHTGGLCPNPSPLSPPHHPKAGNARVTRLMLRLSIGSGNRHKKYNYYRLDFIDYYNISEGLEAFKLHRVIALLFIYYRLYLGKYSEALFGLIPAATFRYSAPSVNRIKCRAVGCQLSN